MITSLILIWLGLGTRAVAHNPLPFFASTTRTPISLPPHLLATLRGGTKKKPVVPTPMVDSILERVGNLLDSPELAEQAVSARRAATTFVEDQVLAAEGRRKWYQQNGVIVSNLGECSMWYPVRLAASFSVAFIVAEITELFFGGPENTSFINLIKQWFQKGRQPGGLFRADTWSRRNLQKKPQIIVQAWDRQFAHKYQRALGVVVGLIFSPVFWTLTGVAGKVLAAVLIVAEINHHGGEHLEVFLQSKSEPVSRAWGEVDVACERVRMFLHNLAQKPVTTAKSLIKQVDDRVPDEAFPVVMQQGVLLGVIVGFIAGF